MHAKGSYVFMQLWALGRAARVAYIREEEPEFVYVAPSDVPLQGRDEVPRPLTKDGTCAPSSLMAFLAHFWA